MSRLDAGLDVQAERDGRGRRWGVRLASRGPIVKAGVVYLQDLDSNVYALALASGKLEWRYECNAPERSGPGPNGVAVADGRVYGETPTSVFALSAATGKPIWVDAHVLGQGEGTFGIQPQVADGRVYVASQYGSGPGGGVLVALNASAGAVLWKFNTLLGPDRAVQSLGLGSGGAWETPLVSDDGSVTYGIGNPYQTPAGAIAHPSQQLYTDSDVNLDAATGKLRWYYQGVPNDFKDYDMQASPISARIGRVPVVIGGGKMGYVYELNAETGKLIWKTPVGEHNGHDNDSRKALEHKLTLKAPYTILPGSLGGVLTNMALAGNTVYTVDARRTADLHELETARAHQVHRGCRRRGGGTEPRHRQDRMGQEGGVPAARCRHGLKRARLHHAHQRHPDRSQPQQRRDCLQAQAAHIGEFSDRDRRSQRARAGGGHHGEVNEPEPAAGRLHGEMRRSPPPAEISARAVIRFAARCA